VNGFVKVIDEVPEKASRKTRYILKFTFMKIGITENDPPNEPKLNWLPSPEVNCVESNGVAPEVKPVMIPPTT
jgi:hypothetical protein